METKTRGWLEVLTDGWTLIMTAVSSPKGLELLDEIADLLDLPFDPLPNVDGLSFEDDAPKNATDAAVLNAMHQAGAVNVQVDPAQPNTAKAPTHAEILARRRAKATQ